MELKDITTILHRAELPSLSHDQWMSLTKAGEALKFEANLRQLANGNAEAKQYVQLVIRAVSSSNRQCLEQLGFTPTVRQLIDLAMLHGMSLFKALFAVKSNERRDEAITYLNTLGMKRSAPTQVAKPAPPQVPQYYSFTIFGKSAALCIAEARTRSGNAHTVQIEGAAVLGNRTVDWQNKIIVQLTEQECFQTLALFENTIAEVKFDGHGQQHDKSLHISFQESKHFVRMIQRGRPALAVPVTPADSIRIVSLLYQQIGLNAKHLSVADIKIMITRMAQMMNTPAHYGA